MRNLPAPRFAVRILTLAAVLPAVAQAHPGHDGHELTWDMGHLLAHPWATLVCFAVIGGSAWLAGRVGVSLLKKAVARNEARPDRRR